MATRYAGTNISLFTVGGIALASSGYTFGATVTSDTVDAGLVTRLGKYNQPVKQGLALSIERNGIVSGAERVSHLNVSAFTIGGTSYLALLKDLNLSGSFDTEMQAGIGEKFQKPQVVAKDYSITASLNVASGTALALANMVGGADFASSDQTLSFTIDSVVITIPMNLITFDLGIQRAGLQSISLTFQGADPGAGAYPAAPTGTTSLLEQLLNTPTAELAFSLQNVASGDVNGVRLTGNCVAESFSIQTSDGQLVSETYQFQSYGTVTTAASS